MYSPEVPATADKAGQKAYYYDKLGNMFWNADGTGPIRDVNALEIPPVQDGSTANTESSTGSTQSTSGSTASSTGSSTTSPKTGDATNMTLWMLIMIVSMAAACVALNIAKRKGAFKK